LAQNAAISGAVKDTAGIPIENATVLMEELNYSILSNSDGNFKFERVKSGKYTLICFAFQHEIIKKTVYLNSSDVVINFDLKPLSKQLNPIIIQEEREKNLGLTRMRSVEDFAIYEGKKTEVIDLSEVQANMATNNPRQIYARVTGLNIWESDGAGLQLGIGGRGLNPNRTASFNVRQNGYDISADALGYPESYYTPPTEALDRIEIIRGASSLQYGTQFGGLVNFKFRKGPYEKKLEVTARQTIGSWGFFNTFNSFGGTVAQKKINYYSFIQHKRGDGFRENSGFVQTMAYASVIAEPTNKLKLQLDITYMNYEAQQAGGLTDKQFLDNPRQSLRSRNWFAVNWNMAAFHASYKFSSRTEINTRTFGLLAQRLALGNLERINVVDFGGERTLIDGQFKNIGNETRLLHRYNVKEKAQVLVVGVRAYQGNSTARQGFASDGSDADFRFLNPSNLEQSDYRFPNTNFAVFAEHIFNLHPRWKVTPGLRFEDIFTQSAGYYKQYVFDGAGNTIAETRFDEDEARRRRFLIGGIGVTFQASTQHTVYGNFSQNYRAINFSDLRIVNPNFKVDTAIRDEKGYTADLGIRGGFKSKIRYELTFFYIAYNGKIGQVLRADEPPLFIDYRLRGNISDARNLGFECFVDWDILPKKSSWSWDVYSNFAYVNARYIRTDDASIRNRFVEMVPPIIWRAGTGFSHKKWKVSYQYAYTAQHFSDATNAVQTPTAVEGEIPSYAVSDLTLSYTYKHYLISGSVNNMFNTMYFTRRAEFYPGPGIIPSEGRSFFITVQVKI
jgi:Fe(3+) dicitrate transport protein